MSETEQAQEPLALSDLKPKMRFEGHVTGIELFGAFVDIGAQRDGLVHISQISESRINRVTDAVQVGDAVTVWVKGVDAEAGRVDLTMVEPPERSMDELEPEQVLTGKVTKLAAFGAFVDIGVGRDGLVHISEMAEGHTNAPSEVVKVGDEVQVRVVSVNQKKNRIELSMRDMPSERPEAAPDEEGAAESEDALTAMELAWRNAMERQGTSLKVSTHEKGQRKRRADIRRQQAAIIAQTLRAKQG
jgi:small subunit ribosomal protein S1